MRPACLTGTRREWLQSLAIAAGGLGAFGACSLLRGEDFTAELWPQDEGRQAPPVVTALAVEARLGWLALGGDDHKIRVRSLHSGAQLHLLTGHTDWVRSAVFTPDGNALLSAGNDCRLLLWSANNTSPKLLAQHKLPFTALACSPQGNLLAATTWDGEVRLFDLTTQKQLHQWKGPGADTLAAAFSPNGQWLAVAGGRGRIMTWNTATADVVSDERPFQQRVRALAFSPDGKYLVSAGDERQIHVRSMEAEPTGTFLPMKGCKVFAVQFLSVEEFATAGSDGTICMWNVQRPEPVKIWHGHNGTIAALAVHDQQLISTGFDAKVRVWSFGDRIVEKPADNVRIGSRPAATTGN